MRSWLEEGSGRQCKSVVWGKGASSLASLGACEGGREEPGRIFLIRAFPPSRGMVAVTKLEDLIWSVEHVEKDRRRNHSDMGKDRWSWKPRGWGSDGTGLHEDESTLAGMERSPY